ncbi:IS66 family insertion sequence element accessory protein TnpA [Myxococcus dinghuensis]|uniref:IS66 family insertion sequence element accessory protein TnpA n=1 Tax=Myxococcus dinghuensis TaxID=2906761 RepID=UPI003898D91C
MRRPNPDEWPKWVEEFEASGLQQKEFVAKHDLSLGTLQYWLYKKGKKPPGTGVWSARIFSRTGKSGGCPVQPNAKAAQ